MARDPRIDAYIAKAAPFAQPILEAVREAAHAALPDVEEAIKWGHPTYLKDGKILLGTAAFKAHAAVNFWRGGEIMGGAAKAGAMGQLGKLESVADLPADLEAMIRAAAAQANDPRPPKPKAAPRPVGTLHPDFVAALGTNAAAKATFDGLPPSHQRDYVEWIGEAKQDATRARRIAQAIEWLAEGKRRNWKYENC